MRANRPRLYIRVLFFDIKTYRINDGEFTYDKILETGLIPYSFCISGDELPMVLSVTRNRFAFIEEDKYPHVRIAEY